VNPSFSYSHLLEAAFQEDLPEGDVTSDPLIDPSWIVTANLKAKEDLVLSGSELFQEALLWQHPDLKITWHFKDGDFVYERQTICQIEGPALPLLKAERVALNYLGKLSGIATLTRCFVEKLQGTKTFILDTRKTTPGLRVLEKKAVRDGGGKNHRMSLSDAVLIKDNHLRAAGGLTAAVEKIRKAGASWIEVECSTLDEVREAVALKVQRVLLDNMDLDLMKTCLEVIPADVETEASGNMSLERVRSVADLGVNFISVGQITHSAPTADLSLLFDWSETR
jgi:nicotinate-nucleotide pyrophosphorylase (carboxylating)